MRCHLSALCVMILVCLSAPLPAQDVKKAILDYFRKPSSASDTARPVLSDSDKSKLLNKLRHRLPDRLKGATDALQPISLEHEISIGRQIAGNLLGAAALVDDDGLQTYVNKIGRWVADQSERPELPWHFGVLDSHDVNAFAAPGGYIFVTRGLYSLLQNEAELAGVLGHEIGHVIRRHHLKVLQQSRLLDLGRQIIPKKITDNAFAQSLIGQGAEIVSRALDQNAEFEADRLAVILTARAGYDAFALPAVLQQIGHVSRDHDRVALLFKTHPHPDTRLQKLDARLGDRLDHLKGRTLPNRLYHLKPAKTTKPGK